MPFLLMGSAQNMRYGITRIVLGTPPFLELSEERYAQLVEARRNVFDSLYVEEKFAYLVENYRELEIEALANTVHNAPMPAGPWSKMIADIHLFNRRIINLLTTTRLYIDQIPHHLASIFGEAASVGDEFKDQLKAQYDKSLSYRVLEALRNYVQHRGLPLSGLYRTNRITKPGDAGSPLVSSIQFTLDVSRLIADAKFKRSVAEELQRGNAKIDLRPMLREYVGLIAEVHQHVRQAIEQHFSSWAARVADAIEEYSQGRESLATGLAAVKEDDAGKRVESYHLSREPAMRRTELIENYSHIELLKRQVITSAGE